MMLKSGSRRGQERWIFFYPESGCGEDVNEGGRTEAVVQKSEKSAVPAVPACLPAQSCALNLPA